MRRVEICPTCGINLKPGDPHLTIRACSRCKRPNPEGFNYCGFCATPLDRLGSREEQDAAAGT